MPAGPMPEASPAAPAEPETPAAAEAGQAPEPAAEPQTSPWDNPETARKEIEALRKENADRRVKARTFDEAFSGLDDNDRDAILGFVQAYKADPAQAGAIAKQWGEALTPAERGDIAEATGAAPTDAPMTRAEFERAMAEREQQQGIQSSIAEMQREAKELGYDPEGPEYLLLIQAMDRLGTTDMKQGHAEVQKFLQSKIDAYVASKAGDAERTPVAPGNGLPPSNQAERPTDFGTIKSAAAEFLANLDK